jgi:hypothetical protein
LDLSGYGLCFHSSNSTANILRVIFWPDPAWNATLGRTRIKGDKQTHKHTDIGNDRFRDLHYGVRQMIIDNNVAHSFHSGINYNYLFRRVCSALFASLKIAANDNRSNCNSPHTSALLFSCRRRSESFCLSQPTTTEQRHEDNNDDRKNTHGETLQ